MSHGNLGLFLRLPTSNVSIMRLALLPAFVHAFGTIGTIEPGTNEPCKVVEPASWAQIDFNEFTRASWFGQEQASEGNRVACESCVVRDTQHPSIYLSGGHPATAPGRALLQRGNLQAGGEGGAGRWAPFWHGCAL